MNKYSNNKMFLKNTIGKGNLVDLFFSTTKMNIIHSHLLNKSLPSQINQNHKKKSGIENNYRYQKPTQTRASFFLNTWSPLNRLRLVCASFKKPMQRPLKIISEYIFKLLRNGSGQIAPPPILPGLRGLSRIQKT